MKSPVSPPPIDLFGGIQGLRTILSDFYQRVFRDPMIGYLFVGKDPELLIDREVQWTARALGVHELTYQGQPLAKAHRKHPIRRGHFHRRNQILDEVIRAHHLPEAAHQWWIAHSQAMETAILGPAQGDRSCEKTSADLSNEISEHSPSGGSQTTELQDQPKSNGLSLWGKS